MGFGTGEDARPPPNGCVIRPFGRLRAGSTRDVLILVGQECPTHTEVEVPALPHKTREGRGTLE